jgi:catechol 2,3-dioxygenase-like lactoylglutathione lyase family enzyme
VLARCCDPPAIGHPQLLRSQRKEQRRFERGVVDTRRRRYGKRLLEARVAPASDERADLDPTIDDLCDGDGRSPCTRRECQHDTETAEADEHGFSVAKQQSRYNAPRRQNAEGGTVTIRLLLMTCLALLVWTNPARAQLIAPGEGGVTMGHVHLVARDLEGTRKLLIALGGVPVANGSLQMIQFPGVFLLVRQAEPTGGTVGSVVNHFGFHVKDIKASVARWQAAGLKVEPGNNGRVDQAWLNTADGARIEILEDKSIAEPIRMHHIHWNVAAVAEMQAWYAKHFGAVPGKRGQFDAADLPGVNLTFGKVDEKNAATRGRALDHIGFEIRNLAQFVQRLEAAGVKIEAAIRKAGNGTTSIAFLTDPWGTYIELTEGLAP